MTNCSGQITVNIEPLKVSKGKHLAFREKSRMSILDIRLDTRPGLTPINPTFLISLPSAQLPVTPHVTTSIQSLRLDLHCQYPNWHPHLQSFALL